MDILAFHEKMFVRPALRLRYIIFYFSIFVVSLMTMIKPVLASGALSKLALPVYSVSQWAHRSWDGYDYVTAISCSASSMDGLAPCIAAAVGHPVAYCLDVWGRKASWYCDQWDSTTDQIRAESSCPANSTITNDNTCICTDPYVPDSRLSWRTFARMVADGLSRNLIQAKQTRRLCAGRRSLERALIANITGLWRRPTCPHPVWMRAIEG